MEQCWDADYEKRPEFDEICDVLDEEAGKLGKRMTKPAPGREPSVSGQQGKSDGGSCCSVM